MASALSTLVIELSIISLALVVSLFGLLTVVQTIRIVVLTYSPVLSWDQWQIINTLVRSHGHPTLLDFWAQHNEHRIPTVRLFSLLDLFVFHGRNVSLLVEIFLFQLCHLVLFCIIVFQSSKMLWFTRLTLAGFFAYCFFSPLQMENFNWGFQIGFILTSFSATVSFAAAVWYSRQLALANGKAKLALAVCLLSAFVAEGSNSHGLITWPVLIFLSVALNFPLRTRWTTWVVGAVAIAIYMIGFDPQSPPGSYRRALSHPAELLKFGLTYLGNSWDRGLPNNSAWLTAAEWITLLSIGATILLAIRCLRHRSLFSPLQIFLIGNLLFGIGTVAVTAVGRHRFGLEMAVSSRYQTPGLIYWVCFAALLAVSFPQTTKLRLLAGQAGLLILMMSGASRWAGIAHGAAERQFRLEQAWNAAVQDKFNDPAAASLFYDVNMVRGFVHYMRQHQWGPHGVIQSFAGINKGAERPTRLNGFRIKQGGCAGQIDGVTRSGLKSATVNGWAIPILRSSAASRVVLASDSGKVVGSSAVDIARPDVAAKFARADSMISGWKTEVAFPGNGDYRAFLIGQDKSSACALDDVVRVKKLSPF